MTRTPKQLRVADQQMSMARKLVPGRDTLDVLESIAITLEVEGDVEGATAQRRAIAVLELMRAAVHGGPIDRPMPRRG